MIDFDLHIRNPNQQEYNTAFIGTMPITKTRSVELTVINKTYTWLKIAFSISRFPYLILGLFKFVICVKIK
jgi:hypothetical protein